MCRIDTGPSEAVTVEPLVKDTLNKGRPLYKGHGLCPYPQSATTRSKQLVPKYPLFGGSTVPTYT